ncbi:MAG: LON peptidase substrate-binding domain-containing protein [Planctomycetes bacterium]|nr:LON peptidase substrate-binding domain-containing protein [Planctomycetota bacterium]
MRHAPLFPLPNVWLFPAVILPLQVFEERYRQMIEDSLDGPGRIVLGTIQAGHEDESAGAPPIYPLAGLGEIGRHERSADGRFNILLVGLQRVFVREVPSERLYRKVEYAPAPEVPIAAEHEPELRARLLAALTTRTEDLPAIPPEFSSSHLADMLVLRLPLEHGELNGLYAELDAEKRARAALAEHERRPPSGG